MPYGMGMTATTRPAWALPGRPIVRVTLAHGIQRIGQLLVEYPDDTVLVEYRTPPDTEHAFFRTKIVKRSQVEVIG